MCLSGAPKQYEEKNMLIWVTAASCISQTTLSKDGICFRCQAEIIQMPDEKSEEPVPAEEDEG